MSVSSFQITISAGDTSDQFNGIKVDMDLKVVDGNETAYVGDLKVNNQLYRFRIDKTYGFVQVFLITHESAQFIGRYAFSPYPPPVKQSGSKSTKIHVLGRDRVVTKVGRKSMITYKGKQICLTEAREIERKIKANKKP